MNKRKIVVDIQGAIKVFIATILLLLVFGGFSLLANMIPMQVQENTGDSTLFVIFAIALGFLSLLQYGKGSGYKNSSELGEGRERGSILFLTIATVIVMTVCFALAVI